MVEIHYRRRASARAEDPHRAAIEAACARIAEAPTRRWTPRLLAHHAGMGYHAFRKAFARRMGCGAAAWAVRRRLVAAQELLADPELRAWPRWRAAWAMRIRCSSPPSSAGTTG